MVLPPPAAPCSGRPSPPALPTTAGLPSTASFHLLPSLSCSLSPWVPAWPPSSTPPHVCPVSTVCSLGCGLSRAPKQLGAAGAWAVRALGFRGNGSGLSYGHRPSGVIVFFVENSETTGEQNRRSTAAQMWEKVTCTVPRHTCARARTKLGHTRQCSQPASASQAASSHVSVSTGGFTIRRTVSWSGCSTLLHGLPRPSPRFYF